MESKKDLIVKLISEDIKLNYLYFGLQDLGMDMHNELLGLSDIIFSMGQLSPENREAYYQRVNSIQRSNFETLNASLPILSTEIYEDIFLSKGKT